VICRKRQQSFGKAVGCEVLVRLTAAVEHAALPDRAGPMLHGGKHQ